MQFEFDASLVAPKTKDDIYESFPHVFAFVREHNGEAVVCHSDYLTGSQRFVTDDKSYVDQYLFRPNRIKEQGQKAIELGATHLITGYYDLLEETFKNEQIFELEDTDDFYINVVNKVLPEQYNEMWYNLDLFEANIKSRDKIHSRLNLDTDAFNHINGFGLHEFVLDYFKRDDFTPFKGHLHPTTIVKEMLNHFKVEDNPVNAFFAMQILTTSNYTEMVFYDTDKDDYDYMDQRRGVLDMHVVFGGGDKAANIYPLVIMKDRFLKMMNKI